MMVKTKSEALAMRANLTFLVGGVAIVIALLPLPAYANTLTGEVVAITDGDIAIPKVLDVALISGTPGIGLHTVLRAVEVHTMPAAESMLVDDTIVCAYPVPPRTA
jgi:hypothetical protein